MWPDLIRKAKEGGIDTIETYVFWDHHEPRPREYDFSGNLDFIRFFKTVQEAGLYAILRIGPYVCAEWNYGGFPVWLHNMPGIQLRTDNAVYKSEMETFVAKIVSMCQEAKLFGPQGGPIIFAQIENEYGNVMGPYGEAGKSYVKWCAEMAQNFSIGVPWIMCQQADAPQPMINTCNGFYCHNFQPNNPKSPKMWTENWSGGFKNWGGQDPHRTAEDLAYSVALFFQTGGVLMNYYMYHGGTNFGRSSGGPYIATTYDYDAPLDEYGLPSQPKYGHLVQLHAALKSVQKILTSTKPTHQSVGNQVNLTTFLNNATGEKVCFLSNTNVGQDANIDLEQNGKYFVPAWSVSILAGCNKEIYNTAKVNTPTTVMVKVPNRAEKEPAHLSWTWAAEPMSDTLHGHGQFNAMKLLEQKETTLDASDYLWYMTRVDIDDTSSWTNANLFVNTTGHVLHAYVNGELIGSQWGTGTEDAYNFTFIKNVTLQRGTNVISLLSATVGLQNYGSFFDLSPAGIVGGPVKLISNKNDVTMDLSTNQWSYKVGLNGEAEKLMDAGCQLRQSIKWSTDGLPISKPMTWYKTTFQAPLGTEPVVVDLQGMGKGQAWVNGQSIGRYWPAFLAPKDGCNATCDYRGVYSWDNCMTNCGNPTQRWYHVPRSFLRNDKNTLVLFEEMGGNPTQVAFKTVTIGAVCSTAYEGSTLELSCQGGKTLSNIQFASFGDPKGTCQSFSKGSCESATVMSVVQKACTGKEKCSINISEGTLGTSNCANDITRRVAVQAVCEDKTDSILKILRSLSLDFSSNQLLKKISYLWRTF
ncbi:beta-galactosidase-like [Cornus florida]|uniref:beta-galactosidase-like n=1 Tax=Cornus florida TaxID=4283 RepID=UPI00289C6334|nr:beta-galactosidase-like [Cornus florida]